jgi:hypothetical protein
MRERAFPAPELRGSVPPPSLPLRKLTAPRPDQQGLPGSLLGLHRVAPRFSPPPPPPLTNPGSPAMTWRRCGARVGRRQRRATSVLHLATPNTAPGCPTWTRGQGRQGRHGESRKYKACEALCRVHLQEQLSAVAAPRQHTVHRHAAEMNLCTDGV